jgi:hypothetical protein
MSFSFYWAVPGGKDNRFFLHVFVILASLLFFCIEPFPGGAALPFTGAAPSGMGISVNRNSC